MREIGHITAKLHENRVVKAQLGALVGDLLGAHALRREGVARHDAH